MIGHFGRACGLTELQFYEAESLQARIAQSGVTRSLKRNKAPKDEGE